jgi:hypothetical protein
LQENQVESQEYGAKLQEPVEVARRSGWLARLIGEVARIWSEVAIFR